MFIAFIETLIGSIVVIRILELMAESKFFAPETLTKIGTGYVAVLITTIILVPRSHFWIWLAIALSALGVVTLLWALIKRRERRFRDGMSEILSVIALKMRAGRSFRQSFSELIEESSPEWRGKLAEILSAVVFSQQNSASAVSTTGGFVAELVDEFMRIDRHPHAASKRLDVLRNKLRIESEFRRRSGQVLSRIRAQSIVMTGLYFGVLLFVGWKFGIREHANLIVLSAFLYGIGALWIAVGGRRLRWKV